MLTGSIKVDDYSFSGVPGVASWNTADIVPAAHSNGATSVKSVFSASGSRSRKIDRDEPCFITKSLSYTHEVAHWVNAVRGNPVVKQEVEELLKRRVVVHLYFTLDDKTNLTHLDRSLHAALDRYAFFAVTGSLSSLDTLIEFFEKENNNRQESLDRYMWEPGRSYWLLTPEASKFQYELVVLRPEHFLPDRSVLTVYQRSSGEVSTQTYMIGQDRTLRESPANNDLDCKRFPSFTFDYPRGVLALNPFLVILNAEIKFRRYLREIPTPELPDDVMTLIRKTIRVVELIYWDPVLRLDTPAAVYLPDQSLNILPPAPAGDVDMGEFGMRVDEQDVPTVRQRDIPNVGRRRAPGPSATLEERQDYGQYLMSGHDLPNSDDEYSSEGENDSDDEGPVNSVPAEERIRNWQRTVEF